MKTLGWLKSFETGNAFIDDQHKKLLLCLKELAILVGQAKSEETHAKCQELQHLVDSHFADEESFLRDSDFPRLDKHVAQHLESSESFNRICSSCEDACKGNSAGPCLPNLAIVLVDHFLQGDLDFKSFLQMKGLANGNH